MAKILVNKEVRYNFHLISERNESDLAPGHFHIKDIRAGHFEKV